MAGKAITMSYHGLDQQVQRLAQFDAIYLEEMGNAMGDVVDIASGRAKENAPNLSGELQGSIYGKVLSPFKTTVKGAIGTPLRLKGLAQEFGRWYGRTSTNHHYWKGKFYLYFGAKDKADQISQKYNAANEKIVKRLAIK